LKVRFFHFFFHSRAKQISSEQINSVYFQLRHNPKFRGTYFTSKFRALHRNNGNFKHSQLFICSEAFMLNPEVIYTQKDFYLLDKLSKNIENLKASGLIEWWHKQIFKQNIQSKRSALRALDMQDFQGCVLIVSCGLSVSFVVYCVEFLLKRVIKRELSLR
jgi:hypothetical protein